MIASGFSWYHLIPGVGDDTLLAATGLHGHTYILVAAWASALVVVALAFAGRASLASFEGKSGLDKYVPDASLSLKNIFELLQEMWIGMMGGILDRKDVVLFGPLIAALFLYIFVSNVQALLPGFLPPTDNVSHNASMAVFSFLLFMGVGLGRDPVGFIKHLMGPVLALVPLLFVIETIGLIVRPITLTLRLSGNMTGDHMVFVIMSGLLGDLGMVGRFIPFPAILLAFGLLVSFIQAFVFALLSAIYIGLSVPHGDHDDHH